MTYVRPARSHRPHSLQCAASILPAMRLASAVGLSNTVIPSGTAMASRIGPINFFAHQFVVCRARALVKRALNITCIVRTGIPHPEKENFSITKSPDIKPQRAERSEAKDRGVRQHGLMLNKALRNIGEAFIPSFMPSQRCELVRSAA